MECNPHSNRYPPECHSSLHILSVMERKTQQGHHYSGSENQSQGGKKLKGTYLCHYFMFCMFYVNKCLHVVFFLRVHPRGIFCFACVWFFCHLSLLLSLTSCTSESTFHCPFPCFFLALPISSTNINIVQTGGRLPYKYVVFFFLSLPLFFEWVLSFSCLFLYDILLLILLLLLGCSLCFISFSFSVFLFFQAGRPTIFSIIFVARPCRLHLHLVCSGLQNRGAAI